MDNYLGDGLSITMLLPLRKSFERVSIVTDTFSSPGFGCGVWNVWSNGSRVNGRQLPDDNPDDDDLIVDPSLCIVSNAHVLLRGKADAAYGDAGANSMSMSWAIKMNTPFMNPFIPVVLILR